MTDRPLPPCPSCGVAWENHNGITKTCAELQAARREVERLKAALETLRDYAGVAYERWDRDQDAKVGKMLMSLAGLLPGYMPTIDAIHKLTQENANGTAD